MDYFTSKVFVIAVGIFVTLSIVTGVIFVFSNINDVYNLVENTNTSIFDQYDNIYSAYSGSTLNTVGLLNTLRKYEETDVINISVAFSTSASPTIYGGKRDLINDIEDDMTVDGIKIAYETLYDVSVSEDENNIYITFNRK